MTKIRWFCVLLSAVFLSVLCIPCAATDTEIAKTRLYLGFSDVSSDLWCKDAVQLCYETGLLNGVTDVNFAPAGTLTMGQLLAITARLENLERGGDGTLPSLPKQFDAASLIRFYDRTGKEVANAADIASVSTDYGETGDFIPHTSFISLSAAKQTSLGDQPLTMVLGLDGYGETISCTMERETRQIGVAYPAEAGQHFPDLSGDGTPVYETGYVCTAPVGYNLGLALHRSDDFSEEAFQRLSSAWWFPACFYLWANNRLCYTDLIHDQFGRSDEEEYDPLVRFSRDAARRVDFVSLLHSVTGDLNAIRSAVPPDVSQSSSGPAILNYYAAGVVNGFDETGSFRPDATLNRGQAAAMLARLIDPSLRCAN